MENFVKFTRSNKPMPFTSKKISYKQFSKMLEGVTITFSGYKNPRRAILRDKAIAMGAKYQPNWFVSNNSGWGGMPKGPVWTHLM